MARPFISSTSFTICISSLLLILFISSTAYGSELEKGKKRALFVFGDSTVDLGNNNYIETIPENRADYEPYGQNGFFGGPTGRFSDGRVIVDFIAEYAQLPVIPPFLKPSADYSNGVNFASGGAGILPETNHGLVIDLQTQLKSFEEVEKTLAEKFGKDETEELISAAVYFISTGSNDYMGGYLGNPTMQQLYQPQEFVGMVIGNLTQAIQVLYGKGARNFGFLSLSPLGCLPALRAANPRANEGGGCFDEASALAMAHNNALKTVLTNLEYILKGFKYCNSNFYDWLLDRIENPSKYGFKDGVNACCGTGPYNGILTCGGTKNITTYELCERGEDYVWWDSFHPTEGIHKQFAEALWSGTPPSVGPYSLQDLFFSQEKLTIADVVDDPEGRDFSHFQ
ncbi:GDSL esterase/lipase 5-like [Punica granatum]|uniref:Uncharacterized protein n=2 Tax=Punica granatum TaxID=22663 RepID=A0A218WNA4_PUNGR|nr:GDSL esterase/lipase 5-like [Punica granatum]OWM74347.1 hypothetical protein CDL15_Pgr013251 [Punica granatum]PKI71595.1 hypothetical protein CRG98_008003 [Punica granatum]